MVLPWTSCRSSKNTATMIIMKIPTTRTNTRMYDNFYNAHLHVCTHACTQACPANPTSHILANIPLHPLYRKTTSERVRFGLTLGVSVS